MGDFIDDFAVKATDKVEQHVQLQVATKQSTASSQFGLNHRPIYVPGNRVHPRNDASASNHTMGSSIFRYLEIKVHEAVLERPYNEIIVMGAYSRHKGTSIAFEGEKRDKPFNWERPTARLDPETDTLFIECFPGYDHIEHYAEIIACFLRLLEEEQEKPEKDKSAANGVRRPLTPSSRVAFFPASCSDTRLALCNDTNLDLFPGEGVHTVVLGQVWHLGSITQEQGKSETVWEGEGPFQWVIKTFPSLSGSGATTSRKVAFLGFRPAFWGCISGELIHLLASRFQSVREVIYLGKLGTLTPGVAPNRHLATGSSSLLSGSVGRVVEWENVLAGAVERRAPAGVVISGRHVTLGSVLHETKDWHADLKETVEFVDPEIGMMAQAGMSPLSTSFRFSPKTSTQTNQVT